MILDLAVAAFIVAFYLLFITGIFLSLKIMKDGIQWKDPTVISGSIALLMMMLSAIAFSTYVILEAI
jgi:uncharacterized protein YneF (UPF0154 family)